MSSSKDGDARIWDITLRKCVICLSGHTLAVTCVKWGGDGMIYTGYAHDFHHPFSDGTLSIIDSFFPHLPCYKCSSQDCTIKVWETTQGKLICELKVNACLCIAYIVSPHVLLLNGIGVLLIYVQQVSMSSA